MSSGRSMATDLPTPSGMKREVASLAATRTTEVGTSAPLAAVVARLEAASIAASVTVRISEPVVMSVSSPRSLPRRHGAADAEANDVDGAAGLGLRVGVGLVGGGGVSDAAQRQRQRAQTLTHGQRFRLRGREFERRGLADHDALSVLFRDVLVDRQDADIGEDRLAALTVAAAGLVGVALGQDDVDAVVRQDEAAGAGLGRNLRRNGTHAGRQDGGHVAGPVRVHELGLADWLTRDEGRAGDLAGKLLQGVGAVGFADEIAGRGAGGPGLPLHLAGGDRLTETDVGFGDEDLDRVGLDRGDRLDVRRFRAPGEQSGDAAGSEGDDKDDKTRGFHTL